MVAARFNTLVSAATLFEHLQDPCWRIFDCRFRLTNLMAGQQDYFAGHIPSAHYVHLENHLSGSINAQSGRHPLPDAGILRDRFAGLGIRQDTQVVVYDDSFGSIAARMWWLLRWVGLSSVALLDGGLHAWLREQRPLSTAIIAHTKTQVLPGETQQHMWVNSQTVLEGLADPSQSLIDVRSEPRYLAIDEPIDSVAGHIPGAVNIPYEDNLGPDGRFLSASELRAIYAGVLDAQMLEEGSSAAKLNIMCGSGVTACHSLLALERAGLYGAKLYAGSWSEWIRDPTRPRSQQ